MERGKEMKITVVGFLAIVGTAVLIGLLAYQLGTDLDKRRRKSDEQPNGTV